MKRWYVALKFSSGAVVLRFDGIDAPTSMDAVRLAKQDARAKWPNLGTLDIVKVSDKLNIVEEFPL